ncbi:MAG: hypothetical protein M3Q03_01660 [Chloroflexota bacterium]|nr:hypothetical protein [Chloroflexota bacterium]
MNSPFGVALIRGILQAAIAFATTTLTTYQASLVVLPNGSTVRGSWDLAFIAGGIAGLTILATRVGGEGIYDQGRDSTRPPAVSAGDVGVPPRRSTVYDVDGDGRLDP